MPRSRAPASPFRYFKTSPEVIRLAVLLYVKYPLSLKNLEDLLFERGIDISHVTVRYWWNRFGPNRRDARLVDRHRDHDRSHRGLVGGDRPVDHLGVQDAALDRVADPGGVCKISVES
ncbi:MAG: hypothetical protein ABIQ32_10065 [Sphingomicrobium sp.]